MNFTAILLTVTCLQVGARSIAQNITLSEKNVPLQKVFKSIEDQTGYVFFFNYAWLRHARKVSVEAKNASIKEALDLCFKDQPLTYEIVNKTIVLQPKTSTAGLIGSPDPLHNRPIDVKAALITDKDEPVLKIVHTVTGTVTTDKGEPLEGASVTEKGYSIGVTTDSKGRFSINLAENEGVLLISHVGYQTQELTVGTRTTLDVRLISLNAQMDAVIVVGYGTQKKSDITGSVTSVPKDRLSKIPVTNVLQALEGSVAGYTLTQTSSVPGSSANQQVRGLNSITASTTPLIILDGVPFPGQTNDISPGTIESIEVLKDASATAIYGTRGSSGVILITTKRGSTGKPTISYSGFAGGETWAHEVKPMDATAFKIKNVVWNQQTGGTNTNINSDSVVNATEVTNHRAGKTTDWMGLIKQPGYIQSHNLSFSGGTKDVKYFINGEYTKEKGILKGYQYTRISLRSNLNANLTDWLAVGTSLFYTNNNTDGGHSDLTLAGQMSPYGQPYNPDGSYDILPMYGNTLYTNPLLGLYKPTISRNNNLTGTGYVDVTPAIIPGLKYRLNGSYTYLPTRYDTYTGRNANDNQGTAIVYAGESTSWILENILTYTKDLKKHHFDLTALYSAQKTNSFNSLITAKGFINDGIGFNNTSAATTQTTQSNFPTVNTPYPSQALPSSLLSQMGRLNYSYAGKYLLTATIRRDGYSAFGNLTDKYGAFPSVALGWNIHKEDFMNKVSFINLLKLRVSEGTTGNSAITPFQTQTTQSVTQYIYNNQTATGLIASNLGNANLKWESTTGTNLGIDFAMMNNRISGTIEGYQTKTSNLLLARQLPSPSGYASVLQNIGKLQNRGLDVTINTVNIRGRYFSWQTTVVFSTYKNKLLQLYGDNKDDIGNSWFLGKSLGALYTYQLQGVWQTGQDPSSVDPTAKAGYLKFADLDHNHAITAAGDRAIVGYTTPSWTGGITNTFSYKSVSLRIFIQTVQGNMKNNQYYDNADQSGAINLPASVGYWTAANNNNSRPSLAYTNPYNYAYPSKANFTRIKDITLNYVLPQDLVSKWGFGNISAYISGRNIHTWTPWLGWDPEANYQSLPFGTYNNYPLVASYVFGLNFSLK
ncbi:MAG TPA: TonB-dependent receptor [Puia sp.]|jgi:TonB-linked SusC/RagA family outer membrane protein